MPASSDLTIDFNTRANRVITVNDVTGRALKSKEVRLDEEKVIIDLHDLSNGVYILKVFSEGGPPYVQKFVISK